MSRFLLVSLLFLISLPTAYVAETYEEWKSTREWNEVCGGSTLFACASIRLDFTPTRINIRLWNLSGLHGSDARTEFWNVGLQGLPTLRDGFGQQSTYARGAFRGLDGTLVLPSGPVSGFGDDWELYGSGNTSFGLAPFWGTTHLITGDPYLVGSPASSCALPDLLGYNYFMNPTCGSGGVTGSNINDGWFEIALNLEGGYFMEATDLSGLSVNVSTNNRFAGSTDVDGLRCGGADANCAQVTPEPVSVIVLGSGLAGIGLARRRKRERTKVTQL